MINKPVFYSVFKKVKFDYTKILSKVNIKETYTYFKVNFNKFRSIKIGISNQNYNKF